MPAKAKKSPIQHALDFENPQPQLIIWPTNDLFPLNIKSHTGTRTVLAEITRDVNESTEYLVVTGFTSLAHIIEFFGRQVDFLKIRQIRIVLGFEPELRTRKFWKSAELDKDIKDYWANQHYSLLNGGVVIRVIELIKSGKIDFRLYDGLHAKIYVGDFHAILGSANFSKNGTTIQQEANIRVADDLTRTVEKAQYEQIAQIANNFYQIAKDYNAAITDMLRELLKLTTWQEALARAIVELIERQWLKDIPELYTKLNSLKLWPSQRLGLGQALYILQTQGCVLIADPTGSGKTKMISTLQLVLYHWLWETGRRNKSYAITVCPPLVKDSWNREFVDIQFSSSSQISMGALSYTQGNNYLLHIKEIKIANILIVDEAHNFLNLNSQRSISIAEHTSDNIILATATPINKKPKDLIRLIELLGVDNLRDEELEQFKELKKQKNIKSTSPQFGALKTYIEKFIVRRTKTQLNKLIDKEPANYTNREGKECRYPEHICKIYHTGETKADKETAAQINNLARGLKGMLFLHDLTMPDDGLDYDHSLYVEKRLKAAKALTVYNIQAKMRSSKAALLEHIEGTDAALEYYDFKSGKNKSGNVIGTILRHSQSLPKNHFTSLSPDWLTDIEKYQSACRLEIEIYNEIAILSKKLTYSRELKKISTMIRLFKEHGLVLAFDSTVITLDFLSSLMKKNFSGTPIDDFVITGNSSKASILSILKKFDLGSTSRDILALCSDSMSEGVNLQQASALVFLDMPSVLRVAEQRIGRIDRLDSPHKEIKVYWPFDTDEFSLRSDGRLIRTSVDTESLIGSNFSIPDEIMDKHMEDIIRPADMIKALEEDKDQDYLWGGIQDAFKSVHDLYEGENALITHAHYETYKDVDAAVKVKLSIGRSSRPWLFLAVRGTKAISPRWYFVDESLKIHVELSDVCRQLRDHLTQTDQWEMKWSDEVQKSLDEYVQLLINNEITILPCKRNRAIEVARHILTKQLKLVDKKDLIRAGLLKQVLEMFQPRIIDNEYNIDYYHFSQQWLDIFLPLLAEKKRKQKKKDNKVLSLNNLKSDYKTITLDNDTLQRIINEAPLMTNIWSRVAACIIGLPFTS